MRAVALSGSHAMSICVSGADMILKQKHQADRDCELLFSALCHLQGIAFTTHAAFNNVKFRRGTGGCGWAPPPTTGKSAVQLTILSSQRAAAALESVADKHAAIISKMRALERTLQTLQRKSTSALSPQLMLSHMHRTARRLIFLSPSFAKPRNFVLPPTHRLKLPRPSSLLPLSHPLQRFYLDRTKWGRTNKTGQPIRFPRSSQDIACQLL